MVNLRSFQGLAFDPQCLNVSFTQKKRRLLPDKCNLLSIYKNVQGSNFFCQIWASAPVFYVKISEVFTGKCFYTKAVQKFFYKTQRKTLALTSLQVAGPELSLRQECPYSKLFWSAFSRIRTEHKEILRISPYSLRMRKTTDQNNSEYGHFLYSVYGQKDAVGYLLILRNFLERLFM